MNTIRYKIHRRIIFFFGYHVNSDEINMIVNIDIFQGPFLLTQRTDSVSLPDRRDPDYRDLHRVQSSEQERYREIVPVHRHISIHDF